MNEEQNEYTQLSQHTASVWPIRSPWRDLLLESVEQVRHSLLLVSPFLTEDVIVALETMLQKDVEGQDECIDIRLLTRVRLEDFKSGASSLGAIERLLQWPAHHPAWLSQARSIDNIHAKVWVFDDQFAFVGSGNATHSGLEVNIEYGLAIKDPLLVAQICADWQPYWEQATPITLEDLASIGTALQHLRADPTLVVLEQKSVQRHNFLIEELKIKSRIGKKIVFPVQKPIAIPQKTILLTQYDFWRALNWTIPSVQQVLQHQPDAYLRIDWFATSSELQLTRANQAQLSRATIHACTQDVTMENRHITLNKYALQELFEVLQSGTSDRLITSTSNSWLDYQITLDAWPEQIGINKLQVPMNMNEPLFAFRSVDPKRYIQNIPTLQKPLSHITIKHKALVEQIATLEIQWQKNHPKTAFPDVVELRFSPRVNTPGLIFSIGPLNDRLETFIPGDHCVQLDPSLTFRLSTNPLLQMLAGSLHLIEEWHIQVGYDANALQLQPLQSSQMPSHLWFHQLNNIE